MKHWNAINKIPNQNCSEIVSKLKKKISFQFRMKTNFRMLKCPMNKTSTFWLVLDMNIYYDECIFFFWFIHFSLFLEKHLLFLEYLSNSLSKANFNKRFPKFSWWYFSIHCVWRDWSFVSIVPFPFSHGMMETLKHEKNKWEILKKEKKNIPQYLHCIA